MNLTFHGHACVGIETPSGPIIVDPGAFSVIPDLAGAASILITHAHGDHLATTEVGDAARWGVPVYGPVGVARELRVAGQPTSGVREVVGGDRFSVGGLEIEVLPMEHAIIHVELPSPSNVGFLIGGTLLHPGDSVTAVGVSAETLLLPVAAPWLALGDAIEFALSLDPLLAIPIHDAILSEAGMAVADHMVSTVIGARYRRMQIGETVDL